MAFLWFGKQKISVDLSRKKNGGIFFFGIKGLLVTVLIFLSLGALFLAYHFYHKYESVRVGTERALPVATDPVQAVVEQVDRHMLLPGGEQPSVAKVTDLAPLAQFPFFRNAQVGDEVLVYCRHELSILYSPTRDKIIEVSPQALSGACTTDR